LDIRRIDSRFSAVFSSSNVKSSDEVFSAHSCEHSLAASLNKTIDKGMKEKLIGNRLLFHTLLLTMKV
jgi:hypothetical protein